MLYEENTKSLKVKSIGHKVIMKYCKFCGYCKKPIFKGEEAIIVSYPLAKPLGKKQQFFYKFFHKKCPR